jgi:hypothetical protein
MYLSNQMFGIEPCKTTLEDSRDFSSIIQSTPLQTGLVLDKTDKGNFQTILGYPECKVTFPKFSIDRPWLPLKAKAIIEKLKKGPISESDATTLMQMVADQVTSHFNLKFGKFVASTLTGRIVETANTRIELLQKIQGQTFNEEIFVWTVGADAFSGRL